MRFGDGSPLGTKGKAPVDDLRDEVSLHVIRCCKNLTLIVTCLTRLWLSFNFQDG